MKSYLKFLDKDVLDIICFVFFGFMFFVVPVFVFSAFFDIAKLWVVLFSLYCFVAPKIFLKCFVKEETLWR